MKQKTHATRPVVIKRAAVDVLMVPLVNWLNSFEEVTTLYCCQGEPGDNPGPLGRPYVTFTCTNPLQLMTILDKWRYAAKVEISYDREYPVFRYRAEFPSQKILKSVIPAKTTPAP